MQSVGRIIGPPIKNFLPARNANLSLATEEKKKEEKGKKKFLYRQTRFPLLDTPMLVRELNALRV